MICLYFVCLFVGMDDVLPNTPPYIPQLRKVTMISRHRHTYIQTLTYNISPYNKKQLYLCHLLGARCSSVVRAFAHGPMGRRIDPSWGGPIELFLIPVSGPRLV